MDLDLSELGLLQFTSDDDGATGGVYFHGLLERGFRGEHEELAEHLDYVVVGMLVVVQKNDVIQRSKFFALSGLQLRNNRGRYQLRW
jgi:hypothetical protein